jgi:AraC-like DNA-binding protein
MAADRMPSDNGLRHQPVYEPIVPLATECFIWRTDDYPLSWSVWNAHPECEIHLIKSAGGTCHIGDFIGGFDPGDLFIVGRGLPHNWVTPLKPRDRIENRDVIVQFDEDRILAAANLMPELTDLRSFFLRARRGIAFNGEARTQGAEIMEAMGKADGIERLSLFLTLLAILSKSAETALLSSEGFSLHTNPSTNQTVREVLAWISANYQNDIRIEQPAALIGMTGTSFSRFFKRNTGTTFSNYLIELRMGKASELLLRSDLPITTIAAEAGYDNLSNFNLSFKKSRGMTPTGYRKSRGL